jgi:putative DNA methylase
MIRELKQKGETDAGGLLARMADKGESIRQLAYHLFMACHCGCLKQSGSEGRIT